MTAASWPAALEFVWRPENDGAPIHTDAGDSGGATSWGVTHATWAAAVAHGYVPDVPLAQAAKSDLGLVLKVMFWGLCRCDDLASGVDLAVFNLAMLGGPGRASSILQGVVGTLWSGPGIGKITLGAAAEFQARDLIEKFTNREEAFYAGCPTATADLRGWDRRADDCRAAALKLAGLPAST